jgi:hypothetical protein
MIKYNFMIFCDFFFIRMAIKLELNSEIFYGIYFEFYNFTVYKTVSSIRNYMIELCFLIIN